MCACFSQTRLRFLRKPVSKEKQSLQSEYEETGCVWGTIAALRCKYPWCESTKLKLQCLCLHDRSTNRTEVEQFRFGDCPEKSQIPGRRFVPFGCACACAHVTAWCEQLWSETSRIQDGTRCWHGYSSVNCDSRLTQRQQANNTHKLGFNLLRPHRRRRKRKKKPETASPSKVWRS